MRFLAKLSLIVLSIAFACGFAIVSFAQPGPGPQEKGAPGVEFREKGERAEAHIQKMVEELNPTPQQRQEIESHRSQNFEKAKELRRQLQETGKQLKEELDKPVSDIAKVNALAAQIKALEASKVDERIQKVLELKKILTPQQYQLLQEKIKENRAKHPRPMKD